MSTRTAVRRLHLHQWRSLSTSTEPTSVASRRGPPANRNAGPKAWHPEENLRSLHPRMIFVRPWDGIPSMAHAFAIIREIERRFGKIQEFVVLRDSDVLTSNMPYMHATFARAEYADTIPLEGRVIQVAAPPVNAQRDGGVGLDDIEVYLDPAARAETLSGEEGQEEGEGRKEREWGPPDGQNIMDIKLERSGMRDPPPALDFVLGAGRSYSAPYLRNRARARELADAMLSFGGFSDAPNNPSGGMTRMQAVMSKWGQIAGQPTKTEPTQESKATPSESDVAPSTDEEVLWTPFTQMDQASTSDVAVDSSSPSSSFPSPPPSPSSIEPSSSQTEPPPQSGPKPESSPEPVAPKLSKKQRMLLAARSAGAVTVSQAASENGNGTSDTPVSSPEATRRAEGSPANLQREEVRSGSDDAVTREEENKLAARKWWNFLTGGKG